LLTGGVDPTRETVCPCTAGALTAYVRRLQLFKKRAVPHVKILEKYRREMRWIYSLFGKKIKKKRMIDVVNSYSGRKRAVYAEALVSYEKYGLGPMSFPAFSKPYELNDPGKIRARAILPQMSRQIDANGKSRMMPLPILIELAYGRYAQERSMGKLLNYDGTPMTTCGLNPRQIAQLIIHHMEGDYVALSLDVSAFDGFLGDLAEIEREEFLRHIESMSDDIIRVMKSQKRSNLSGPIAVNIPHIRQSGTAGTGLANKLCMLAILRVTTGAHSSHRYLVAGDDALLFVPRAQFKLYINSWLRKFQDLALQVKVEGVAHHYSEVTFCRARVTLADNGYTLIKLPLDAIQTALNIPRHVKGPHVIDYITTRGEGYQRLWRVPILHELGVLLASANGRVRPDLLGNSGLDYMIGRDESPGPKSAIIHSPESREAFQRAFGITAPQQIAAEAELLELSKGFSDILRAFVGNGGSPTT
jgi:hypothetical protein